MVDYSKWDNLDSDSDSDSDSTTAAAAKLKQAGTTAGTSDKRVLEQAEVLRLQGNSAYERGDVSKAIGAYDAQLRMLEGRTDETSVEMICGALLNQASGFIRLKKFAEAEARCSRVLACTTPSDGVKITGGATARTRALHFRGFARLQQGLFDGACSDLRSSLAAGSSSGDEARALLLEAEAGASMASCPDPEATGRELLRQGQGREAAEHFREAASRARRRKEAAGGQNKSPTTTGGGGGRNGGNEAVVALARNLRMEGVAVAMAGDRSSAELLLRAALKEVRGGGGASGSGVGSAAGGGDSKEEEGLALAALGSLLAQGGKHANAVKMLREAVFVLDEAIAGASAKEDGPADSANARSSTPSSPTDDARKAALTRTLTGTLAFLGTSIVALEADPGANGGGNAGGATDKSGAGKSADTATGGTDSAAVEADDSPKDDGDEAVRVLKRAHEILKAETAATVAVNPGQLGGVSVTNLTGGESRGVDELRKQTAKVLDTLSEAYAGKRRWEHARSAAEQSLTAWRSLGYAGREGAAASLLSLGHLVLQLHGVSAGIEEASSRWEEAAMCFNDRAEISSVAAEVRLKIAGFYTKVVRSDPSRLESLEGKIAAHYAEAAALFAREREQKTGALKRSAAAVAAAEAPRNTVAGGGSGTSEPLPPLPPSVVDSLEPDGRSRWELAEKEAFAWEGYAGAVGDEREAAAKALRKAEGLLDQASVSEKDERWTLRKVGVLHSLALVLAQDGEHAMAEDKLLEAIRQLQELDGVDADAEGSTRAHKETLTDLFKYLAIARRARGDLPGAKEALARVESLGGSKGREDVEDLDRLMAENKISVD
eukprot:g12341.t1